MYLTEITVIKPYNRQLYKACDELCFLSKNLYNTALYIQRQNYQEGGKYIKEWDMSKLLRAQKNHDFYALHPKAAEYVVKQLHENHKSYFALDKLKKEGKYTKKVRPPSYKDPVKGRNVTTFYKTSLSSLTYRKEGLIHLLQTNIKFKSKIPLEKIQEVRVVPKKWLL